MDIDSFRVINEYYGFEQGTKVLQTLASTLLEATDLKDTLVTRVNSDHFLIFKKKGEEKQIREICNTYIIPKIKQILGQNYLLSLSMGVYVIHDCDELLNTMIERAIHARRKGKAFQGTTYFVFDQKMKEEYNIRKLVGLYMEKALEDNCFDLNFIPKLKRGDDSLISTEVVAKWRMQEGISIELRNFYDIFEKKGCIHKLELLILEKICDFLSQIDKEVKIPQIVTNISMTTIIEDETISRINELIQKYKISPDMISIYVITQQKLNTKTNIKYKIKQLHDLGIGITIENPNNNEGLNNFIIELSSTFYYGKRMTEVEFTDLLSEDRRKLIENATRI